MMLPGLAKHPKRWLVTKGPMSATISTLLDLGWKPVAPDKWLVEDGGGRYEATLGAGHFAKPQVLRAAQEAAVRRLWESAAEHSCGKGLEEGPPSLRAAKSAKYDFIKEGKVLGGGCSRICGDRHPPRAGPRRRKRRSREERRLLHQVRWKAP